MIKQIFEFKTLLENASSAARVNRWACANHDWEKCMSASNLGRRFAQLAGREERALKNDDISLQPQIAILEPCEPLRDTSAVPVSLRNTFRRSI